MRIPIIHYVLIRCILHQTVFRCNTILLNTHSTSQVLVNWVFFQVSIAVLLDNFLTASNAMKVHHCNSSRELFLLSNMTHYGMKLYFRFSDLLVMGFWTPKNHTPAALSLSQLLLFCSNI